MIYTTYWEGEDSEFISLMRTVSRDYIVRTDEDGYEEYGFSDEASGTLLYYYMERPEYRNEILDPRELSCEWCEYTAAELADAYAGDNRSLLSKMEFAKNATTFAAGLGGGAAMAALTGDISVLIEDCIRGGAKLVGGLINSARASHEEQRKAAREVIDMLDGSGEFEILYIEGGSYLVRRAEARNSAPLRTTYEHTEPGVNLLLPGWLAREALLKHVSLSEQSAEFIEMYYDSPRGSDFIPNSRMIPYLWGEYAPRQAIGEMISNIHAVLYSDEVNYLFKDRPDFWEDVIDNELGQVGQYGSDEECVGYIQGMIDTYGLNIGGSVRYIGPVDGEELLCLDNGNILICKPYFTLPQMF